MHRRDIIEMSLRDLKRLKVIQEAIDRHIPQRVAASILQVSERQVRRMVRRVRQEGYRSSFPRSSFDSSIA